MKIIILGLALVALVHGQSKFHDNDNIKAVEQDIQPGQAIASLNDLRQAIGLSGKYSLSVESERQTSNGLWRQKLRISYKGIPIRVARLQASIDCDGKYTGAVSGYYPEIPNGFKTNGKRSDNKLKKAIVQYLNDNDNVPDFVGTVTRSQLQNFNSRKEIDIDVDSGDLTLVHFVRAKIDILASTNNGVYLRFIRAVIRVSDLAVQKINTRVLRAMPSSSSNSCPNTRGGNAIFPGHLYGDPRHGGNDYRCLNAKKSNGKCSYANELVTVYDSGASLDRSNPQVFEFDCSKGPDDSVNGAYSPSSDVFFYVQEFYRMFSEWGRVNSTGMEPLAAFVHYGDRYGNSFFDGHSVCFGDGVPDFSFPFTTAEAVGHEVGHSVVEGLNNLQIGGESLILNEAFGDFCGHGLNVFASGCVNSWNFGESILKSPQAVRFFNDPSRGDAASHISQYDPSRDTYYNMGIFTKVFFQVIAGHGIPYSYALETMIHANQLYWSEESTMIDGACGILRAASDISLDTNAFRGAFADVGINLDHCDLSGTHDTIACRSDCDEVIRDDVIVSRFKSPSFKVIGCEDFSHVTISVEAEAECEVELHQAGGNGNLGTSAELSTGNDGISVFLTASAEAKAKVTFSFH